MIPQFGVTYGALFLHRDAPVAVSWRICPAAGIGLCSSLATNALFSRFMWLGIDINDRPVRPQFVPSQRSLWLYRPAYNENIEGLCAGTSIEEIYGDAPAMTSG